MGPKSKKTKEKTSEFEEVLNVIDRNALVYIENLKEFANIYSSPLVSDKSNAHKMMAMKRAVEMLKDVGAEVEECFGYGCEKLGTTNVPVVLASLGNSEDKKTVLVYCEMDGSGYLPLFSSSAKFIRGKSIIDSASFLIWINMILSHKEAALPLPYNIKFCLEAVSRCDGSQLVETFCPRLDFLFNPEFCIACTSHGLNTRTPAIIYGFRGICHFFFNISQKSDKKDILEENDNNVIFLDSLYLMNSLMDSEGIAIEGLEEDTYETSSEERDWFSTLKFNPEQINNHFWTNSTQAKDKVNFINRIWCHPAISIKGIYAVEGEPQTLRSEFSVLTAVGQKPKEIRRRILAHLTNKWKERKSNNELELGMNYWAWPWRADQTDLKYRALADSINIICGEWPESIMSGSHLPFPAILRKLADKNILFFTFGSFYDFHQTDNERLLCKDFIKAIKIVTRTLHFVEKTENPVSKKKKKN